MNATKVEENKTKERATTTEKKKKDFFLFIGAARTHADETQKQMK